MVEFVEFFSYIHLPFGTYLHDITQSPHMVLYTNESFFQRVPLDSDLHYLALRSYLNLPIQHLFPTKPYFL